MGPIGRTIAELGLAAMLKVSVTSYASFVPKLTLQFQESRTRPTPKPSRLQCTPVLASPAEVGVDLAAADLRLQ